MKPLEKQVWSRVRPTVLLLKLRKEKFTAVTLNMKSLTVAVAFVVLFSYTFVVLFSIAKLKVLTLVQGNFNRIGVFGLTINLLGRLDATEMQFAAEKVDKPLSQAEVKRSNDPPFHSVHLSRAPPYFHTPLPGLL